MLGYRALPHLAQNLLSLSRITAPHCVQNAAMELAVFVHRLNRYANNNPKIASTPNPSRLCTNKFTNPVEYRGKRGSQVDSNQRTYSDHTMAIGMTAFT